LGRPGGDATAVVAASARLAAAATFTRWARSQPAEPVVVGSAIGGIARAIATAVSRSVSNIPIAFILFLIGASIP
jgi:orotate phosphoribosyltransferase